MHLVIHPVLTYRASIISHFFAQDVANSGYACRDTKISIENKNGGVKLDNINVNVGEVNWIPKDKI